MSSRKDSKEIVADEDDKVEKRPSKKAGSPAKSKRDSPAKDQVKKDDKKTEPEETNDFAWGDNEDDQPKPSGKVHTQFFLHYPHFHIDLFISTYYTEIIPPNELMWNAVNCPLNDLTCSLIENRGQDNQER